MHKSLRGWIEDWAAVVTESHNNYLLGAEKWKVLGERGNLILISAAALEATAVTRAEAWILLDWLGLVWLGLVWHGSWEARKLGSGGGEGSSVRDPPLMLTADLTSRILDVALYVKYKDIVASRVQNASEEVALPRPQK